ERLVAEPAEPAELGQLRVDRLGQLGQARALDRIDLAGADQQRRLVADDQRAEVDEIAGDLDRRVAEVAPAAAAAQLHAGPRQQAELLGELGRERERALGVGLALDQ